MHLYHLNSSHSLSPSLVASKVRLVPGSKCSWIPFIEVEMDDFCYVNAPKYFITKIIFFKMRRFGEDIEYNSKRTSHLKGDLFNFFFFFANWYSIQRKVVLRLARWRMRSPAGGRRWQISAAVWRWRHSGAADQNLDLAAVVNRKPVQWDQRRG